MRYINPRLTKIDIDIRSLPLLMVESPVLLCTPQQTPNGFQGAVQTQKLPLPVG